MYTSNWQFDMGPEYMTGAIHYLEVSINRSSFVQYFYNSQGNGLKQYPILLINMSTIMSTVFTNKK